MLTPTLHSICNDRNAHQTLLVVTAEDLNDFAMKIAREIKRLNEPEYFTREELLQYLNVCPRTLYGYEAEGIITAEKVGRQKRYNKAAIYEAIKLRKLKPLKRKMS